MSSAFLPLTASPRRDPPVGGPASAGVVPIRRRAPFGLCPYITPSLRHGRPLVGLAHATEGFVPLQSPDAPSTDLHSRSTNTLSTHRPLPSMRSLPRQAVSRGHHRWQPVTGRRCMPGYGRIRQRSSTFPRQSDRRVPSVGALQVRVIPHRSPLSNLIVIAAVSPVFRYV